MHADDIIQFFRGNMQLMLTLYIGPNKQHICWKVM